MKKGQVLARFDPSTFQTALEQARANLVSAEADAQRLRVAKQSADVTLARPDAQPSTGATRASNPLLSAGRPPGPPLR